MTKQESSTTATVTDWRINNPYRCVDPECDTGGSHHETVLLSVMDGDDGIYLGIIDEKAMPVTFQSTYIPNQKLGEFLADVVEAFLEAVGHDSRAGRELLETANVMRMADWRKK